MTAFAELLLAADTTQLAKGEAALRSLAKTGAQTEAQLSGTLGRAVPKAATTASAAMVRAESAATKLGRGFTMPTNSARMLGQQLSQVAQQGAMTGNYLGALAVQLPDMAMGFGNLAIAASIVATVAMPLLTSAFGNGKTAAENMADANDRLGESLGRLRSMADQSLADIAAKYGEVNAAVIALMASQRQYEMAAAQKAARDAIAALADEYANLDNIGKSALAGGMAESLVMKLGIAKDQAIALRDALHEAMDARTPEAQVAALAKVNAILLQSKASGDELTGAAIAAQDALMQLSYIAPKSGWLSGAIADAVSLAGTLWNAVSANLALSKAQAALAATPALRGPAGMGDASTATVRALDSVNAAAYQVYAQTRQMGEEFIVAGKAGKAGGGAAAVGMSAAEEAIKAAEDAAKDYADTMQGYVADGIDSVINEMVGGFKGGLKGIANMLMDTIKQMIAFAIANPIKIAMGLMPTMAGAATPTGGGILGNIGSAIGGLGSAFGSGMSAVWGAISSGGLSSGLSAVGSALGGITSGLSGFATALGAIALPVAALGAVFSFFKTKTKLLDSGFRITVDGMDALVESFKRVEKSRFWGLSKSRKTIYSQADADIADPIIRAIRDMEKSIIGAADILGFGSDAFADFTYQLKLSTKGMSNDEALQALQDKLAEMGDAFAGMVPGLADLQKEGEGAMDAITRLSQSLSTVNSMADTLGLAFRAVGLAGADIASKLADAFGGLDALSSATAAYYQAFYSEAERNETAIRQATSALEALGGAMPRTRDEYRAMVAGLDLTTEAGRKLFAALVGMSGVMDQVLPKIASFSAAAAALADTAQTGLAAMLDAVQSAQTEATGAANGWRDVAKGLRDFIADLRGAASEIVTPLQALAYNQTRFADTLARALGGNREAAGNLTGAADALLASVADTARTGAEAAIAQARVLADLGRAADVADTTAVGLDTVAGLLGEQIGILGEIRDYLTAGGDAAGLQVLLDRLTASQAGIGAMVAGSLGAALAEVHLPLEAPIAALNGTLVALVAQLQADAAERAAVRTLEAVQGAVNTAAPPAQVPATPTANPSPTLDDLARVIGGHGSDIPLSSVSGLLGNVRAFAKGGDHSGGLRIVGENGPELEATGASRIWSANRTAKMLEGNDGAVVRELRALRKEVAELRDQSRQLDTQILNDGRRVRKIQEDWDANGMPAVRA